MTIQYYEYEVTLRFSSNDSTPNHDSSSMLGITMIGVLVLHITHVLYVSGLYLDISNA